MDLQDILNVEGEAESETEYFESVQRMINALDMWRGPGRNGRSMMEAIDAGRCMLGHADTRDYYGNHIPSRDQVKAGTKGSYEYVVEHAGVEWADKMRALT